MHVCAGCCSGRDEAVAKAQTLINSKILRPMPLPAMNKWTKVAPTVAHIALVAFFHEGFVVDAFKAVFGELQDTDSELSNNEEAKLEVPINEAKRWRLLARRRNLRATNFLLDQQSLWINLLWCHLASGTMALHARLFKNATWFTDRPPRELSRSRHLLAVFLDPSANPAWTNVQDLVSILANPDSRLPLLVWKFGPLRQWPQPRRRIVRKTIMVMIGQLTRKLIFPWQQYPWCLWPLALSDVDEGVRRACAQDLLSRPSCCLDSGFSQRLKGLRPRESELLSVDVRRFLDTVFQRIAPTSTFIERKFAHFTHWCRAQPKFAGLAAKHITSFCKGAAQAFRDKHPQLKQARPRARPSWAHDKVKRTTGYNIFVSDYRKTVRGGIRGDEGRQNFVQEATAAWRRLTRAEKASYSLRARGANSLRKKSSDTVEDVEAVPDECGGLWGMCRLNEPWPLSPDRLQAALGEGRSAIASIGSAWEKAAM